MLEVKTESLTERFFDYFPLKADTEFDATVSAHLIIDAIRKDKRKADMEFNLLSREKNRRAQLGIPPSFVKVNHETLWFVKGLVSL